MSIEIPFVVEHSEREPVQQLCAAQQAKTHAEPDDASESGDDVDPAVQFVPLVFDDAQFLEVHVDGRGVFREHPFLPLEVFQGVVIEFAQLFILRFLHPRVVRLLHFLLLGAVVLVRIQHLFHDGRKISERDLGQLRSVGRFLALIRTLAARSVSETLRLRLADLGVGRVQIHGEGVELTFALENAFQPSDVATHVPLPGDAEIGIIIGQTLAMFGQMSGSAFHQTRGSTVILEYFHRHAHLLLHVLDGIVLSDAFAPRQRHVIDGLGAVGEAGVDADVSHVAGPDGEPFTRHLGEVVGAVNEDAKSDEIVVGVGIPRLVGRDEVFVDVEIGLEHHGQAEERAGAVRSPQNVIIIGLLLCSIRGGGGRRRRGGIRRSFRSSFVVSLSLVGFGVRRLRNPAPPGRLKRRMSRSPEPALRSRRRTPRTFQVMVIIDEIVIGQINEILRVVILAGYFSFSFADNCCCSRSCRSSCCCSRGCRSSSCCCSCRS